MGLKVAIESDLFLLNLNTEYVVIYGGHVPIWVNLLLFFSFCVYVTGFGKIRINAANIIIQYHPF